MAVPPQVQLQGAQAVLGFLEKGKEAGRQQARYEQNRINAVAARDLKIQALNQRAIQESEAVAEDKMALAIKALETKERQKVAAGEAGVAGKSVKQQQELTEARKLRGISKYDATIDRLLTQVELEKAGLNAEAMNRINAVQQGQPPSLMGAVVGAAANAVAMDVQYGDGDLFGIKWTGDKTVTNLNTFGTADNMTPIPSNDITFELLK